MPGVNPSQILILARDNNAAGITTAVQMGADPNWGNNIGQTALHIASLHGNLDAMATLLSLGADPNTENDMGHVPLHFAAHAHKNAIEACLLLLDADADPLVPDNRGILPYENAQIDEVRELLGGPNPRMFTAAEQGDLHALQEIFKEDPETDASPIGAQGFSPLHLAARGGHLGVVAFLLKRGSDVSQHDITQGDTAVHLATRGGHIEVVKMLVRHGADINAQNFHKSDYASGNWVSQGEALGPFHQTPLHIAVEESEENEEGENNLIKELLKLGCDVNCKDFDKRTPLHCALENQDEHLAELLLAHGADPQTGCNEFASPIHVAAQQGAVQVIKMLLKAGAPATVSDDEGWTPLHLAARGGKTGAVHALLAGGAEVGAINVGGNCAVHLAAANGRVDVCKALLGAVGGVEAAAVKNKEGKRAVDMVKTPEMQALFTV